MCKYNIEELYNYCCKLLSIRDMSINEIKEKLRNKKAPEDIINLVVEKLIKNKLLDDERFAKYYIEKNLAKAKKLELILNELVEKYKVDKTALKETDLKKYKLIQYDYGLKFLEKKYKTFDRIRIYRFLSLRGFEEEEITQIINKLERRYK